MDGNTILIGKIIGLHGVKGELKVKILTDFPERFASNKQFEVAWPGSPPRHESVVLESVRPHKDNLLVKFKGIMSRTDAAVYVGAVFQIDEKDVKPLPEGSFYEFQIMGLKAYYLDGAYLGVVKKILSMPHHDIYVIEGNEEVLVPALKKVIKKVDLDEGALWVDREMMTYLED
jgi:16S rRNA processing protein RimM